ncbi:hypothetical protein FA15DRAFT_710758 [Coprinopsis marcescibilis]|uniref:HNH nuclease domain-containing protein n=1 Tax=Coprinopsis marcescibilis TaxID=230819 RepID=A0A5C3KC30_COPMA|nr:hypothetical protein FA15DRAFT_710758 [Coprinopsis marcescibilis]
MAATIQVYAPFPCAVAPTAEFDLDPANWNWAHYLTLPIETLAALQFSQKPYKWIRYAIGVIVGAEGDLSPSPDLLNVVDYNAGLPVEAAVLYYHINDQEKGRMFPVEPKNGPASTTSSVATTRRVRFRSDLSERDGGTCVLTGLTDVLCDAVHLLAHSKGNAYITMYTQRHSRDPNGEDIVRDIDNIRNGLFLNKYTHAVLGTNVAFLVTPNFAMTTADIDPNAPATERRYTAHNFRLNEPAGLSYAAPGTPLRTSDTPEWPPNILFDAVYAQAVLHQFGNRTLMERIMNATWNNNVYPGGIMTTTQSSYNAINEQRLSNAEGTRNRAQGREARTALESGPELLYKLGREARTALESGPELLYKLVTLQATLAPWNEREVRIRQAQEKAEGDEQRRVQETVESWRNRVNFT